MNSTEKQKSQIGAVIAALRRLSTVQTAAILEILTKFNEEIRSDLIREDFLDTNAFEYFTTRLAIHHASSNIVLKKENFEHILNNSFTRSGHDSSLSKNAVNRGSDLTVNGKSYSLKTEAANSLRRDYITISKLMEARWIRDLRDLEDIPGSIRTKILPHFNEYEKVFMLRGYEVGKKIRYDLREIPQNVLRSVSDLRAQDFKPFTKAGSTRARCFLNNEEAFSLVLDGSVEKITISGLNVKLCPLHAWWVLERPG